MARPSQDHQIRITKILDVVESLFDDKGYCETTISDIAKKMGVAQGMLYYYFKSKDDILEALIKRKLSFFVSTIKDLALSNRMTPPCKIKLLLHTVFQIVRSNKILLDFVYDDQHLHIKAKASRQVNLLLAPWLLKIIEEGVRQQYFHIFHAQTTSNFILIIMQRLIDVWYEKMPLDLFSYQLKMAEVLIERALGAQEGVIHISLETIDIQVSR
jgi:AcrR family transcriptional regulator